MSFPKNHETIEFTQAYREQFEQFTPQEVLGFITFLDKDPENNYLNIRKLVDEHSAIYQTLLNTQSGITMDVEEKKIITDEETQKKTEIKEQVKVSGTIGDILKKLSGKVINNTQLTTLNDLEFLIESEKRFDYKPFKFADWLIFSYNLSVIGNSFNSSVWKSRLIFTDNVQKFNVDNRGNAEKWFKKVMSSLKAHKVAKYYVSAEYKTGGHLRAKFNYQPTGKIELESMAKSSEEEISAEMDKLFGKTTIIKHSKTSENIECLLSKNIQGNSSGKISVVNQFAENVAKDLQSTLNCTSKQILIAILGNATNSGGGASSGVTNAWEESIFANHPEMALGFARGIEFYKSNLEKLEKRKNKNLKFVEKLFNAADVFDQNTKSLSSEFPVEFKEYTELLKKEKKPENIITIKGDFFAKNPKILAKYKQELGKTWKSEPSNSTLFDRVLTKMSETSANKNLLIMQASEIDDMMPTDGSDEKIVKQNSGKYNYVVWHAPDLSNIQTKIISQILEKSITNISSDEDVIPSSETLKTAIVNNYSELKSHFKNKINQKIKKTLGWQIVKTCQYVAEENLKHKDDESRQIKAAVFGALGCGVFSCSPNLVAQIFKEFLVTKNYKSVFDEIRFAVKVKSEEEPIFSEFKNQLDGE